MARNALQQIWRQVRGDLEKAIRLLPSDLTKGEAGTISDLEDYLSHNELELALDVLIGLGEANLCPVGFWLELRAAAGRMGLSEHVSRISRQIEGMQN